LQLGSDTVRVTSSYGMAASGQIKVINRPAWFAVTVNNTDPYLKESVYCTLKVMGLNDTLIKEYDRSRVRILIEAKVRENGVERAPTGKVDFNGTSVVDAGNSGYINAGAVFDSGTIVVRVLYDVAGETLIFRFTEDTTNGVTGTSPGVIWEDASLISQVYLYPSPMDFNRPGMLRIAYRLKYDAKVTVRIFSAEGSYVWEKSYRQGGVGGKRGANEMMDGWDGRNRKGKNVGSGAYLVRIKVQSPQGEMEKNIKIGVAGRK
jgi:hypothetical protein